MNGYTNFRQKKYITINNIIWDKERANFIMKNELTHYKYIAIVSAYVVIADIQNTWSKTHRTAK